MYISTNTLWGNNMKYLSLLILLIILFTSQIVNSARKYNKQSYKFKMRTKSTHTIDQQDQLEYHTYKVFVPILNMKSEPGIKSPIIRVLKKGTILSFLNQTEIFETHYRIRAPWFSVMTKDGRAGYVFSGFLKPDINNKHNEIPLNYMLAFTNKENITVREDPSKRAKKAGILKKGLPVFISKRSAKPSTIHNKTDFNLFSGL